MSAVAGPLVVLDTSVIIAGMRSSRGASAALLREVGGDAFRTLLSPALALEYESVLARYAEEIGVSLGTIRAFISFHCSAARRLSPNSWPVPPYTGINQDDMMVAHLAIVGDADYLVTHNVRHFAGLSRKRVNLITPGAMLRALESR